MATCKNCLHYEACSGFIPSESDKAVWHYASRSITDQIPDIEERCSTFCNTADVAEVKHGEWVETTEPLGYKEVEVVGCTACGETFITDEDCDIDYFKTFFNYCPNCGAKMDGGNE